MLFWTELHRIDKELLWLLEVPPQWETLPEVVACVQHYYTQPVLSPEDFDTLHSYLCTYIAARCWNQTETIGVLRTRAAQMRTMAQLDDWMDDCLAVDLDPFS